MKTWYNSAMDNLDHLLHKYADDLWFVAGIIGVMFLFA